MTNQNVIRPIEPRDHAAWLALWAGYLAFYKAQLPDAITQLTWSRLHDPMLPLHGWVAEVDGRVVGFTHALEHLSTWSAGPYVYLEDLFVAKDVRTGGIGRRLIEAVYAHAANTGASKVYWQTANSNAAARRLYDKIAEDQGLMVYQH